MLKRERIAEHLALQDKLNHRIHHQWVDMQFKWTRAILVEAVELLDHWGWKWWKSQSRDIDQVHLELVDIWHFILSHELSSCDGDQSEALGNLSHGLSALSYAAPMGYGFIDIRSQDVPGLVGVIAASAAADSVHMTAFSLLMEKVGLSWEKLDRLYRAKNVLNLFRQDHGYQDGTYIKVWHGKEDNEVVADLLEAKPDATLEQLSNKLESIYSQLTKEPA